MSSFLFATWDGGGNVPPAIGIAAELRRQGHQVRFLGHEAQRESITAAGFAFAAYAGAEPFVGAESNSFAREIGLFTDRRLGTAVLTDLDRDPADMVVSDCLLLGVLGACLRSGQPVVSLEHLYDGYLRSTWARSPIGAVATVKGIRPGPLWDAADLCLVATAPTLDPGSRRAPRGNLRFTGPVLDRPAPHDLAAHEPALLVSLSTYHYPGMSAALQRILDATAGLDARVIVTTGPVIDPASLRAAANHELHRFVPHDQLMPEVSLVIGHGGHATTMRALAHDVPLVVMPMHPLLDQPMVGASVARAGAGVVVSKRAKPAALREAVDQLLPDGPHRVAAARLGAEIRRLGGAASAAEELLGVLRDRTHPVAAD